MHARPRYGRIGGLAAFAVVFLGGNVGAAGLAALDDYVLVAGRGSSAIAVIDSTVDEVVASVPLAAPADTGRKLYVALSGSNRLAVIDMAARVGQGDRGRGRTAVGRLVGALSYCH